jgi:hypothetical protein
MGRHPKQLTSFTEKPEQDDAELFEVHVTKVSNGYIIQRATGEMMVFEDAKFATAIEWIVSRRLKKLEPGEEMELSLKQTFTKIVKPFEEKTSQSAL